MKKFYYLMFLVIGITSCSKDSLNTDAVQSLKSADAKAKVTVAESSVNIPDQVCAGVEANYCIHFPQATKGNGDPKTSEVQVQLYDEVSGEYVQIAHSSENTEFCFSYTFDVAGTYDLRYQYAGGGTPTDFEVTVDNCGCEESFSYDDAGDEDPNTYTFYYTPSENMTGADLVFTFAQSVAVSGLDGWNNNGNGATSSTDETTMDLVACTTYQWTVSLSRDCSGHSGNSNLWTDFKVNDVSKKNENTPNITQSCLE